MDCRGLPKLSSEDYGTWKRIMVYERDLWIMVHILTLSGPTTPRIGSERKLLSRLIKY